MKILIVTPLFPPDTAPLATYAKELATRLTKEHEVTVLLYGHLPEKIPGVTYISVDKRQSLFVRLFQYTKAFFLTARRNEKVFILNGPSVEIPATFMTPLVRTPYSLFMFDTIAEKRMKKLFFIEHYLLKKGAETVYTKEQMPTARPEILPFRAYPQKEMDTYEHTWKEHLNTLL